MRLILPAIVLAVLTCPATAAKIYKWQDKQGIVHISSQPPKNTTVPFQTIVSAPNTSHKPLSNIQRSPSAETLARRPSPKMMPKKNIIKPTVSKKLILDVVQGQWNMTYDGGHSKLVYRKNGKFTYRNVTKKSTFTHNGSWLIYKKRNRWYIRHKGKYLTKTRYGKTYSGAINDLYIIKNLSGKKMVLLEAKNRRFIKSTDYDLNYSR